MKKIITLSIFILLAQVSFAQDFKFGKVSKEELQEKEHPLDAEAVAAVLYKNETVYFNYSDANGFEKRVLVHERVKIYKKEGFSYASKILNLYSGTNDIKEKVSTLKAVTYNLNGNKIEKSKLKNNQIFDEDVNKYWKRKKFTMPNVNEGSVIEYQYEVVSGSLRIDDIEFQYEIPINNLEVKVKTPDYFRYKTLINPKSTFTPEIKFSEVNQVITLHSKQRSGAYVSNTQFKTDRVNVKMNVIDVTAQNVPALKKEWYVDNLYNYQSKLILELNTIAYPREPIKSLSTTWEKVSENIFKDDDFGAQINRSSYYKKDLQQVLSDATTEQQKVARIFSFIKSKVKWNGFNGFSSEVGVSRAYKDGAGNVADINLMLVSMIREAGIDAYPVLVSTRNNGIPILPTRSGFNYVVCLVQFNEGAFVLDATNDFTLPNILPQRALNWKGRLIKKDGTSQWINLTPTHVSKETVSVMVSFDEDMSANGKVRKQLTDYLAYNFRNKNANLSEEQLKKNIEAVDSELEVSEINIKNLKDLGKPIMESYDFVYHNATEEIGDKIYISPLLFLNTEENPFKEDTRNYPIDFIYPMSNKYMVNINLPEGYAIESLPENIKAQLNEKDGVFTCLTRQNANSIQIIYDFTLNKSLILPEEYAQFKQFFQAMIDAEAKKIVLKKI